MTRTLKRKDPGPGGMFVCSLLLHVAFLFLMSRLTLLPGLHPDNAPVYYVDVVNMPVASPQAGNPSGSTAAASPPAPEPQEMKLPAKTAAPARIKSVPAAPTSGAKTDQPETAREFEERLSRLERDAESRHQAAALDALRKRTATGGQGQAGMPGGTGKEAGSDYSSYIRSRLEDAFRQEDTFKADRNKVVEVRLTIDRTGRIISKRIERSSSDIMFNEAVNRAIVKAEREFRPPPGGGVFEQGFIFKPQGVGKN